MWPILFHLGPLTLHTYGLLVAIGFLVAYGVARRTFEMAGLAPILLDRIVMLLMISGILGARLFYFLLVDRPSFVDDPMSFFRLWEGGLVYYGGFLGAVAALAIYVAVKELSFIALADALVAPLLVGQAIGRLGCFAAGCCYGRPSTSFLSVSFTHPDALAPIGVPLLPAQLFESGGDFALFLLAIHLFKKSPYRGTMTAFYLVGYGLFRFAVEFSRNDFRGFVVNGLAPSQWIGLLSAFVGTLFYLYVRIQNKKQKTDY